MPTALSSDTLKPDLILVNRSAGGGRAEEALPLLEEFARRNGWRVEFSMTKNQEDLAEQARGAAASGRDRIFALGGDGTFQVLLNALAGVPDVILGILPAGGGNDLAAALGLPPNPVRAAELLLAGETCFLDAARVHTADGTDRLYTGGGGVGLDAEAARYAGGVYRRLRGRFRYLLSAVRALVGFRSIRVQARFDPGGAPALDSQVLLFGVLNTPSYGAGLRLAPGAKTDDGKLDLVLVEHMSFLQVLATLPALATRGELHTKRIQRHRVEHVWIETDRPCSFHGDGEIIGSTPVQIEVLPKAVRILRARAHPDSSR